jgi:flavin reductase (DIM6/NTAB) family NADH-FMN oxidoreductase RutF
MRGAAVDRKQSATQPVIAPSVSRADVSSRAWHALHECAVVIACATSGRRFAAMTLGVSQASQSPTLVAVSTRCGMAIDPALRDARTFSLCTIEPDERVLLRRLAEVPGVRGIDPFDGLRVERTPQGLPVLASARVWIACEIIRHIDLEADHQLYVGRVVDWRLRESMQAAC